MMEKDLDHCLMVTTGVLNTGGGIASVNRLVLQSFLDQGYCVDIFALLESQNVLSSAYTAMRNIRYRSFAGNKYRFSFAAWRALLTTPYKYVFVDHVNLASILAPLSLLGLCHYMVWVHGIEVFPPRPDLEGRVGLKFAWKRISSSAYTQQVVQGDFPRFAVTACDLSMGPDFSMETPPSINDPEPPIKLTAIDGRERELGPQVILQVGRMVPGERYKGQESLLRAFPEVLEHNLGAQLVLAGKGDDAERLRNVARELPAVCQSHIFMPGFVPDRQLDELYCICCVFAMPSIGEGFGLAYLEAMSRGKPCLGGNLDATPSLVRHQVTGLLVDDPRSPKQVAEALTWFLSHPQESLVMGQNAAGVVSSYYLFPHFRQRFWNAIFRD